MHLQQFLGTFALVLHLQTSKGQSQSRRGMKTHLFQQTLNFWEHWVYRTKLKELNCFFEIFEYCSSVIAAPSCYVRTCLLLLWISFRRGFISDLSCLSLFFKVCPLFFSAFGRPILALAVCCILPFQSCVVLCTGTVFIAVNVGILIGCSVCGLLLCRLAPSRLTLASLIVAAFCLLVVRNYDHYRSPFCLLWSVFSARYLRECYRRSYVGGCPTLCDY